MQVELNDTTIYTPGLIEKLLLESYQDIPTTTAEDRASFAQFDQDVSDHPQWLGQYVFLSSVDGVPVGFVSFDPRQKPTAIIGHNCVVPDWRGQGIGEKQLMFALNQIKEQGFTKVTTSTCDNQYFRPAQRMYASVGFTKIGVSKKEGSDLQMIRYELRY